MLNEVLGAAHHHRRKVRVVWVLELFASVVFLGISQTSRTTQNRSRADLTKSGELQSGEQCLPPGRLIFQHVMKTGGLSLEKFLKCSCSERPNGLCTIRIAANHWGNTAQPKRSLGRYNLSSRRGVCHSSLLGAFGTNRKVTPCHDKK